MFYGVVGALSVTLVGVSCAPSRSARDEAARAKKAALMEAEIDPDSAAGAWLNYLPSAAAPSRTNFPSNKANVAPPSVSSVEAAAPSVDEDIHAQHAGDAIALRGAGRHIMALSNADGTALETAAWELANDERSGMPVEEAILTKAPMVPPPLKRNHSVLLKVALTTTAKIMQLTNRLKYEFWTFNDMVPGPMVRARVGDIVELTLTNTDRTGNPHNIDCHGFEGPGGGAPITTAQQGESKVARFKLLYPGLYVYHCAAAPVPAHIMNGEQRQATRQPRHSSGRSLPR